MIYLIFYNLTLDFFKYYYIINSIYIKNGIKMNNVFLKYKDIFYLFSLENLEFLKGMQAIINCFHSLFYIQIFISLNGE